MQIIKIALLVLLASSCALEDAEEGPATDGTPGEPELADSEQSLAITTARLRNVATGRCLQANGSTVVMAACSTDPAQYVTPINLPAGCWDPYSASIDIFYSQSIQALRFQTGTFLWAPNGLSGKVQAVPALQAPLSSEGLRYDGTHQCNHVWTKSTSRRLIGTTVWGTPLKITACITDNGGAAPVMTACGTTNTRQHWTQF